VGPSSIFNVEGASTFNDIKKPFLRPNSYIKPKDSSSTKATFVNYFPEELLDFSIKASDFRINFSK
jgi:hypothetical protein